MSGNDAAVSGRSKLWLIAALLVVALSVVINYRATLFTRASADNSLLVWYVGVQHAEKGDLTQEINAKTYPVLIERFGPGLYPFRFKQREDYFLNYPLPTLLFAAVASFIDRYVVSAQSDFASFIKLQLVYMWVPSGVIALAILLLTLLALRDRLVALCACIALAMLALLDRLPLKSYTLHFIWNAYFFNSEHSWRAPKDALYMVFHDFRKIPSFLIHPGPAFSAFAFEPKTNFMLVVLGVYALRWSGSFRASYGLLVVASLFEQGYGMLAALFLATIDLIRDSRRILNPISMTLFSMTVIPNLVGGVFWEQIGFHSPIALVIGLCIMLGALIVVGRRYQVLPAAIETVLPPVKVAVRQLDSRFRAPFLSMRDPPADISLFSLLWIVSLIAVLPFSLASSFPQSQYYWGNIHGRLLGLGVPILWTAALISLLSYVRARIGDARTYIAGALAAIAVAIVACLAVADPPDPLPRLAAEIDGYEAALAQPLQKYDRTTENHLYYAISKSIATRRNWLWKLLPQVQLDLQPPDGAAMRVE
jgi:hypothetical protein